MYTHSMASRIPVQKIIENHEVRIRKIEIGMTSTSGTHETTPSKSEPSKQVQTSQSMEDNEVRREVQGIKRDMHEVARRIQSMGQLQQQVQQLKTTVDTLETYCHSLESKVSKMNDFLMATNTDLLRFREQIFENANIKLHIQDQQEVSHEDQEDHEDHEEVVSTEEHEEPAEPVEPVKEPVKERKEINLDV